MSSIDLIGKKFGRLTVIKRSAKCIRSGMWLCGCECGNWRIVRGSDLKSGNTRSCGCYRRELIRQRNRSRLIHGCTPRASGPIPEYTAWANAKKRCFYFQHKYYKNYGGRGITMCKQWRNSFGAFFAYIGRRPPGLTLDRVNNDGNYEPGNIRWATRKQQQNNTRRNRRSIEGLKQ